MASLIELDSKDCATKPGTFNGTFQNIRFRFADIFAQNVRDS